MDILDLIQTDNSRAMADSIVDYIGTDNERMKELMGCFFSNEKRLCQRASWPLTLIADKHPEMVHPYLKDMINTLDQPRHNAVVRNVVRVLQNIEVPEELEGEVYEKCYQLLLKTDEPVANRVFSMTTCVNIALKYPELKEELLATIEDHLPHGTAGFRSRGKKEIERLRKG
jgi:hypothetical protein